MFVAVNGVRLFVAVQGAGLVPDGDGVREKPACSCSLAARAPTTAASSAGSPASATWRR